MEDDIEIGITWSFRVEGFHRSGSLFESPYKKDHGILGYIFEYPYQEILP